MKQSLEKIITEDGIELHGLFFDPEKSKGRALIYIHGFPGNFYNNFDVLNKIAKECNKNNFGFTSFNTRGHDIISYSKDRKEIKVIGAAFERFEDCVLDINAIIKFLESRGFKEIIILGISGGADKVGYYLSQIESRFVIAGVFISPGDNILIAEKEIGTDFSDLLEKAISFVESGRGGELMPTKKNDFPISWQRFVSLYHKSSNENVFPFRNSDLKSKALSKIEKPILLVLGENDKYLYDYNIKSVVDAIKEDAENAEIFDYTIIKNTGHSFEGKEEELAKKIVSWAKKF